MLGGVDVDVSEDDLSNITAWWGMSTAYLGLDGEDGLIESAGLQHLDGKQDPRICT